VDTTIYYFTGTGNSLWIARLISAGLKNSELKPIVLEKSDLVKTSSEQVGIVFPVYMWGLPARVIDFVKRLDADKTKYYFACAVNAGQVAGTLIQLEKLMRTKGLVLGSGFDFVMPSNYIPWGGAITVEEQKKLFDSATEKVKRVIPLIAGKEVVKIEKGPVWQNILLSLLAYPMSFPHVPKMDKSFWVDEKCNSCGMCEKICPAKNIFMRQDKPIWQQHCEQCLSCIQWCSKEAIQYGKKTPGYSRYHHPEIKLSDILINKTLRA